MNKTIAGIIVVLVVIGGWFLFDTEKNQNIAYIALGGANKVGLIDMDSKQILAMLPASDNPHGVAVANGYIFTSSTKMGAGEMAMVPEGREGSGEMKDMLSGADHEGSDNPHHPATGGMEKVGSDTIVVIAEKTGEIIKEINVGGGSHHLAASNDGMKVAVIVPSKNGVVIIDTEKLEEVAFFETGKVSNYGVFSSDDKKLFVSNSAGNTLSIVDLETKKVSNIEVQSLPDHIALGKNGKFVYTANGASNSVGVIDIEKNKVVANISVEKVPHGITISTDGKKLYVANSKSNTVSVIDVEKNDVVNTIKFDKEIAHLEVVPDGSELWVNSEEGKMIYIISTKTGKIMSEIQLGEEPHQIAF